MANGQASALMEKLDVLGQRQTCRRSEGRGRISRLVCEGVDWARRRWRESSSLLARFGRLRSSSVDAVDGATLVLSSFQCPSAVWCSCQPHSQWWSLRAEQRASAVVDVVPRSQRRSE